MKYAFENTYYKGFAKFPSSEKGAAEFVPLANATIFESVTGALDTFSRHCRFGETSYSYMRLMRVTETPTEDKWIQRELDGTKADGATYTRYVIVGQLSGYAYTVENGELKSMKCRPGAGHGFTSIREAVVALSVANKYHTLITLAALDHVAVPAKLTASVVE